MPRRKRSGSFAALTLIFIYRTGLEYEAWIQPDKWLRGILLIHSSLHIDLFLFIYLSAGKKKKFPWIVLLKKFCTLTCSVKNFQGQGRKRDYWGSSYPWIPSSHSSTSMDTSPPPICIGPALLGLVTIYLVTHHHLGGYLCSSQERNSVRLPTNPPSQSINYRPLDTSKLKENASGARHDFTFGIGSKILSK